MMKTTQNKSSGVIQRALSVIAGLALLAVVLPGMALANSGAGAVLLNIATVNYDDALGANSFSATSSASVTVTLLAAAPTIVTSAATPSTSVVSGAGATYDYTITSTANGSDVYDLAGNITAEANLVGGTTAVPTPLTVTLGASVITAVTANDVFEISAGSGTNLSNGDVIEISGTNYLILNVVAGTVATHDNNTGATTDVGTTLAEVPTVITIVINPAGSNAAPALVGGDVGTVAGEQQTFTVLVTGTNSGAVNGTATISPTGTSQDDGTKVGTADVARTTTYLGNFVSILKEVRNVTDAGGFGATATGKPTDVLEYRVTMTNTSAANATAVTLDDPLPAYTTYFGNSTLLNNKAVFGDGAGSTPVETGMLVDDDNPVRGVGVVASGTIGAGNSAVVLYRVTINP